jgi:hypothetical protein
MKHCFPPQFLNFSLKTRIYKKWNINIKNLNYLPLYDDPPAGKNIDDNAEELPELVLHLLDVYGALLEPEVRLIHLVGHLVDRLPHPAHHLQHRGRGQGRGRGRSVSVHISNTEKEVLGRQTLKDSGCMGGGGGGGVPSNIG